MKKLVYITLILLFGIYSCEKDASIDSDSLDGVWTEKTNNSFKHQLIFEKETLFFLKQTSIDTLSYRFDNKNNILFMKLKNSSSSVEGEYMISLNLKKNALTVWGLFASPDKTSETEFDKN